MTNEGGGASTSTAPAQGSSAATDIPLKEHFAKLRECDRDLMDKLRAADKELAGAMRAGDLENVKTALAAAQELGKVHNGLLRRMEVLIETFATKEAVQRQMEALDKRFARIEGWQAKLTGALILLGAIGVTNLVKIWGG